MVRGRCVGISVKRDTSDWLGGFHVACEYSIRTVVIGVVADGTRQERGKVDNVVPDTIKLSSTIRLYSTESESQLGHALAAAVETVGSLVTGCVTQTWLSETVRNHFVADFVELDFSVV